MDILGDDRANRLVGTDEADVFVGFGGDDIYEGGGGDDIFVETGILSAGDDTIHGGDGFDVITYDEVTGGIWADFNTGVVDAPRGKDRFTSVEGIIFGSGNDRVLSRVEFASAFLGAGNDELVNFGNFSFFDGFDGVDWVYGWGLEGDFTFDMETGEARVGTTKEAVLINFENVKGAREHQNAITGTAAANEIWGGGFADVLSGEGGDDRLHGKGGNDTLTVGDGDARVFAGLGDDVIDSGGSNGVFKGGGGADVFSLGAGFSTSYEPHIDKSYSAYGHNGKDTFDVFGGEGTVYGGGGRDTITLHSTSLSRAFGGASADRMTVIEKGEVSGEAGDDKLVAIDAINVILSGGLGDDRFTVEGNREDTPAGRRAMIEVNGGGGDDLIDITVTQARKLNIDAGNGRDVIRLTLESDLELGRVEMASIDGGGGRDRLEIEGNYQIFLASEPGEEVGAEISVYNFEEVVFLGDRVGFMTSRHADPINEIYEREVNLDLNNDGNTITTSDADDSIGVQSTGNVLHLGGGDDTLHMGGRTGPGPSVEYSNEADLGDGNDVAYVSSVRGYVDAGDGDDQVNVAIEGNTVLGGRGNDSFFVTGKNHSIDAGEGDDEFLLPVVEEGTSVVGGGDGADMFKFLGEIMFIRNPSGRYAVDGGSGDDTFEFVERDIIVDSTLTLGEGSDTIVVARSNARGTVVITDFDVAEDVFATARGFDSLDDLFLIEHTAGGVSLTFFEPEGTIPLVFVLEGVSAADLTPDMFVDIA